MTEEEVDRETVTTSAYAVCLEGLPPDTTADEVREFCAQFGDVHKAEAPKENIYGNTFDRTGVVLVRDEGDFISLCYDLVEAFEALSL